MPPRRPMLVHAVYFWLRPDADRALFRAELEKLAGISAIVECHIGTPAPTAQRPPVTDHSFDFSLVLTFPDIAAHDHYQDHPIHTRFVEGCKAMWTRVQVFDAM